jgi:hypothetical protein
MRAKTLAQALNIFDPERPLKTEEELRDYFVERAMSPLQELALLLRHTGRPQTILFTGHRGSGKSTELAKLASLLRDQFFVVDYSVKNVLDLFDVTYVDVIFSLAAELIRAATERQVEVKEELLRHILDFTKEVTKEVVIEERGEVDVGAALNFYMVKLEGKVGKEAATRTLVREKMERRLSDLLENVDLLSREIERATEKKVLVIVEDLDKTDPDRAKELFYGHALSLTSPRCCVIYTFPIALRHDNDFIQVRQSFSELVVLPNFPVSRRDGSPDGVGLACLQEILTRRAEERLFTPGALVGLVGWSGGLARELIILARRACLAAMEAERSAIDEEAVEQAAARMRIDYEVLLTSEQLNLLRGVQERKRVENDEDHRALLHNLSALEYRNGEGVWYDVHPIVRPLLEK